MKLMMLKAALLLGFVAQAQDREMSHSTFYNRVFNAAYMDRPPVFIPGKDSLNRVYFQHFPAFDLVIGKALENGDTAKYLRINFSYHIDADGSPYEPQFISISSTTFKGAKYGKQVKYFAQHKEQLQQSIKTMVAHIPQRWTPGVEGGRGVRTRWEDYVQVWVGLSNPPQ